jgi:hypothetical protein
MASAAPAALTLLAVLLLACGPATFGAEARKLTGFGGDIGGAIQVNFCVHYLVDARRTRAWRLSFI